VEKYKDRLYNSAALLYDRKIIGVYRKIHLPNYGVFDEKRYFCQGSDFKVYDYYGIKISALICEDIWREDDLAGAQARAGSQIIFSINASPFHMGKIALRLKRIRQLAKNNKVCIAYTNLVGGQDELVFDGRSLFVDKEANLLSQAKAFSEDLCICDVEWESLPRRKPDKQKLVRIPQKAKQVFLPRGVSIKKVSVKSLCHEEEVYQALVLGLRDYVLKNGFQKVVLGLSGGIDSSLVAVLAADALGKENVYAVFMPSQFSSPESKEDSLVLAKNLGINFFVIPIEELFLKYMDALKDQFKASPWNVAEENLQARIRGNILMALSNKFGWLVLTTGNKSEISVGYCTLYGDTAGGFAPLKDVPKTLVYQLAEYRNSLGQSLIPERIFKKPPTAELRKNQKDTDSLPAYDILDPILKAYIEDQKSFSEIIRLCQDKETVRRVIQMVDKSEYKRRQSPPGIKITPKAFGRDRRMPITNRFLQQ